MPPSAPPQPAAPAPAWRTFNFFDLSTVKDAEDLGNSPVAFQSPPSISVMVPSSTDGGSLLVASMDGEVKVLNRKFELIRSWIAYQDGRCTHVMEARGIVVTLGEDPSTPYPSLKIWDLLHLSKTTRTPTLLRSTKLNHNNRPHPVSAAALTSNLSHLAIGLGDGTLLLYRQLAQSLSTNVNPTTPSSLNMPGLGGGASSANSLSSLPKPKIILDSATEPITGLVFRERLVPSTSGRVGASASNEVHLFVVSTGKVMVAHVGGKKIGNSEPKVLDDFGGSLGCVVGVKGLGEGAEEGAESGDSRAGETMAVARDEAVYMYGTEARGACFAYEGPKSSIHSSSNTLIIVSPPFIPSQSSASQTVRNLARSNPAGSSQADIARVSILDLENKFVAYSGTFKEGVRDVFSFWGCIFVLANDGKLWRLDETPLESKLSHLYSKSLFLLALNLAKSQGVDPSGLADIHRRYGDHLYAKGDYEYAIGQYVKTLGHLQPSYVIRKFLDAQRIHNLTIYLQELHSASLATSDHTTLLLNCYTKTGDVDRLESFIQTTTTNANSAPSTPSLGGNGKQKSIELPYDLETAIRVCRQAGFFKQAVFLAKKYKRHEDYLSIQIEDVGDWSEALKYLRALGSEGAEENMIRYGKTLLTQQPNETTDLLIDLCSGTLSSSSPSSAVANTNSAFASKLGTEEEDSSSLSGETPSSANAAENGGSGGGGYITSFGRTLVEGAAGVLAPIPGVSSSSRQETLPPPSSANDPSKTTTSRHSSKHPSRDSSLAADGTSSLQLSSSQQQQTASTPAYTPPSPRPYFAHFVNFPAHFLRFLESVAWARFHQRVDLSTTSSLAKSNGKPPLKKKKSISAPPPSYDSAISPPSPELLDQRAIWNTLLELYLLFAPPHLQPPTISSLSPSSPTNPTLNQQKALLLLQQADSIPYNPTHALILCSMNGFTEGLVELWERLGMYEEVLRFWMEKENQDPLPLALPSPSSSSSSDPTSPAIAATRRPSDEVLAHLRVYGPTHPHLYPLVLRFLTSSHALLARHEKDLRGVLERIDEMGVMPTLEVVKVLGRNGIASVGVVKDWLRDRVKAVRGEVDSDRTLIASYRSETAAKERQIEALTDNTTPQVFQVTRCTACGGTLDLPSVHFMCRHSYHQRCIPDTNPDCPSCAHQHGLIREIRANHARSRDLHGGEAFADEVAESEHDGFGVVASGFGRGVMDF